MSDIKRCFHTNGIILQLWLVLSYCFLEPHSLPHVIMFWIYVPSFQNCQSSPLQSYISIALSIKSAPIWNFLQDTHLLLLYPWQWKILLKISVEMAFNGRNTMSGWMKLSGCDDFEFSFLLDVALHLQVQNLSIDPHTKKQVQWNFENRISFWPGHQMTNKTTVDCFLVF